MLQMAVTSDHAPKGVGPGQAGQLRHELQLAGAESLLALDSDGAASTGVTLAVDAAAVTRSRVAADRFRQELFAVLARGLPLSVSFADSAARGHTGYAAVCEQLYRARCAAGVHAGAVCVAVDPLVTAPDAAAAIRQRTVGAGPMRFLVSPLQQQTDAVLQEAVWTQLWRASAKGDTSVALAPAVVSPCALLSAEPAQSVQPGTALQVPAGTAWLPLRLELMRFTDAQGAIALQALEHALRRCVRLGDALHDVVAWPTAQLRHDAWQNRRLAIEIGGLGDLAASSGLDPQHFTDLQELAELLRAISATLHNESRAVAHEAGFLPAVRECDPSLKFPCGQLRHGWRKRWLEAVEAQGLRHRNLITLSPWSLFPRGRPIDYRYADLLPLLSFADAGTFPAPPDLAHWNRNEFIDFHKRAWAVLQQRSSRCQIAEGP